MASGAGLPSRLAAYPIGLDAAAHIPFPSRRRVTERWRSAGSTTWSVTPEPPGRPCPRTETNRGASDIVRYRSSCAGLMPRLRQLFSSGGRFTRSGVSRFAPILHLRSKLGSVAGHAPSAGTGQTNPLSLVGLRTDAMKPIVTSLGGSWSAGSHRRLSAPTTLPRWR